MNKAFTLIELLVVVLIIGILSAIALPQYTVAVEKSRVAEALINAQKLREAQELYHLQNGEWGGSSLDKLDFDISNCKVENNDDGFCYTKYFAYEVDDGDLVRALRKKDPTVNTITNNLYYLELLTSTMNSENSCFTQQTDIGRKVCKSLEGQGFTYHDE